MNEEAPVKRSYDPAFTRLRRWLIAAAAVWAIAQGAVLWLGWHEVEARRAQRLEQISQLCTAVPNAAAAGAQALIDTLVADARRRGVSAPQIAETERLGALYVTRARYLTVQDLTSCPKEP